MVNALPTMNVVFCNFTQGRESYPKEFRQTHIKKGISEACEPQGQKQVDHRRMRPVCRGNGRPLVNSDNAVLGVHAVRERVLGLKITECGTGMTSFRPIG